MATSMPLKTNVPLEEVATCPGTSTASEVDSLPDSTPRQTSVSEVDSLPDSTPRQTQAREEQPRWSDLVEDDFDDEFEEDDFVDADATTKTRRRRRRGNRGKKEGHSEFQFTANAMTLDNILLSDVCSYDPAAGVLAQLGLLIPPSDAGALVEVADAFFECVPPAYPSATFISSGSGPIMGTSPIASAAQTIFREASCRSQPISEQETQLEPVVLASVHAPAVDAAVPPLPLPQATAQDMYLD